MAHLSVIDLACGSASRALDPGGGTGDGGLMARRPDGILLAVVDGVGHGPAAAVAARAALDLLDRSAGPSLHEAVARCHGGLRATRGVTMGIAWIDAAAALMRWLSIGNVSGVVHRGAPGARAELLSPSVGVVGRQILAVRSALVAISVGDTIVLATDGVDSRFLEHAPQPQWSEPEFAERLIDSHGTGRDDAFVLVARCTGSPT